jgi:hypothetical protein
MDCSREPTKEQQVKLVWQEYFYDDDEENLDTKLTDAWIQYRRDGFLELDCDYRIIEHIEIDEEGTRQLAMLPLLKQIYSALEDGSIGDSGSAIPDAIRTMIAKAEGRA